MKHDFTTTTVVCRKFYLSLFAGITLLSLFLGFSTRSSGQDKGMLDSLIHSVGNQLQEKVYLHLDRPNYLSGDTIWFKAYLWYGNLQEADTLSHVLHVELINPAGRIVDSQRLSIEDGTSKGNFTLSNTMPSGNYSIRAYTRMMQDNNNVPFLENIQIAHPTENLQVEYIPSIIKNTDKDSLQVQLRYFEIDSLGNLNRNTGYNLKYSFSAGKRILSEGSVQAMNGRTETLKCNIGTINGKDSIATMKLIFQGGKTTIEKQYAIALADLIDLQFFPEGGNLVVGLKSKVAFKVIGMDGLSREVKGVIKDEQGDTITTFASVHKGMGTFLLTPQPGKKYIAGVRYDGKMYQIPLPQAIREGCVIMLNNKNDDTDDNASSFVDIKYNQNKSVPRFMLFQTHGQVRYGGAIKAANGVCRVSLPIEDLPEGICTLTILDAGLQPLCERLFYVDKQERINIELIPDRSDYQTRDKVQLTIKATKDDGSPAQTDVSMAVIDKEQVVKSGENTGINAYKLLTSELKGNIENPDYYFQGDSVNRAMLDLLLLTQGYRQFHLTKKQSPPNTDKEAFFTIAGKVELPAKKTRRNEYDYRNVTISLMSWANGNQLYQTKADSVGRFSFDMPLFSGSARMFLQATVGKKKKFGGEVYAEEKQTLPWPVTVPIDNRGLIPSPVAESVRQLQAVKKADVARRLKNEAMSLNLKEVVVKAKDKNWYKRFDKNASKIVDLDSIDPKGNKFESLNDLLIREFNARNYTINRRGYFLKTVVLPCLSSEKISDWFPVYVLDGSTYFTGIESPEVFISTLNTLSVIHVNEIKKIMVIPPTKGDLVFHYANPMIYMDIKQSMVILEMYNKGYRGDPQGCMRWIMNGLNAPREFYSPRYEGALKDFPAYDSRATLYWAPSVKTDANGMAQVEFYTSDKQTDLKVVAKGMEMNSGITGEGMIEIKKIKERTR